MSPGQSSAGAGSEATSPCTSCGVSHAVPIAQIRLEPGALAALGEFVAQRRWRRLLVVDDANTAEVLGDRLAAELAASGHEIERVTFPERHGLLADEAAVSTVRRALAGSLAEAALAVGSGTLNDITRYATFLEHRPYCAVPTAASMDGYASGVAAMQFGGVKVTLPAHTPQAIFAEPAVLAAAPPEMTIWGLGDLAGKASASFDWRLGHGVTGEAYCEAVEALVLEPLHRSIEGVDGLLAGEGEALRTLISGLVQSGVAMAMQGNSRPASGSEHHCSHVLDLLAFRGLRQHAPHGLQVAYATGFTTQLQAASMDELAVALRSAPGAAGEGETRWLGESATLEEVRAAKAADFAAYGRAWPPSPPALGQIEEHLARAAALFAPVRAALARCGVPAGAGYLGIDREMLSATLRLANRLRNRFTVLDLLESQGLLEERIDALLGLAG